MNDVVKNASIFRYLMKIANGERVQQSYFVPATTCRYPNQLVKIEVYPDIEWSINVNYTIDDSLYYRNTEGMLNYYDEARPKEFEGLFEFLLSEDNPENSGLAPLLWIQDKLGQQPGYCYR